MDIADLADFYRSIWALGGPNVQVPMSIERNGTMMELSVAAADRRDYLKKRRLN